MRALILVIGIVAALAAGAWIYVRSGAYDVAADTPHGDLVARVLEATRERAIEKRSAGIEVPDLEDAGQVRQGAGNYDAMCASCHLEPGVEQSELSAGLNPEPPNLSRHRLTDPAEAFWIVKHGIKMTGMPAWGHHMEDEAIWSVVAFLRKLPAMKAEEYAALVAASGGHSHGGSQESEQDGEMHVHTDGSRHEHAPAVTVAIEPRSGSQLTGTARFSQAGKGVRVAIKLAHAPPGPKGAHIHEKGDCSAPDAASAGDHFNPGGHPHARPPAQPRHLGDLGNIEIGADGNGSLEIVAEGANLERGDANSFANRAIVIHGRMDDGGQPAGNAGPRIGCGLIAPS